MEKVNWGIIGLGNIANKFAEAFEYSSHGRLLAIASSNSSKLENFRNKFNISEKNCFNKYEELLCKKELDIIYLALPNSLHHKWILRCIDNKMRILVEKPALSSLQEAVDIQNHIEGKKIFLIEGFMYKFLPNILKTLELIKNDEIGDIVSIESNFGEDILTSINFFGLKFRKKINSRNRLFNKDLGGGAILDLGCYTVSFSTLIASLKNQLKNAKVYNKKKEFCKTNVDIDSYAELLFDNGVKSKIAASFSKNLGRQSKIIGSTGEILIHDTWLGKKTNLTLQKNGSSVIETKIIGNIYSYEIDFISKCILENKNDLDFLGLSLREIISNTKIIEDWLT